MFSSRRYRSNYRHRFRYSRKPKKRVPTFEEEREIAFQKYLESRKPKLRVVDPDDDKRKYMGFIYSQMVHGGCTKEEIAEEQERLAIKFGFIEPPKQLEIAGKSGTPVPCDVESSNTESKTPLPSPTPSEDSRPTTATTMRERTVSEISTESQKLDEESGANLPEAPKDTNPSVRRERQPSTSSSSSSDSWEPQDGYRPFVTRQQIKEKMLAAKNWNASITPVGNPKPLNGLQTVVVKAVTLKTSIPILNNLKPSSVNSKPSGKSDSSGKTIPRLDNSNFKKELTKSTVSSSTPQQSEPPKPSSGTSKKKYSSSEEDSSSSDDWEPYENPSAFVSRKDIQLKIQAAKEWEASKAASAPMNVSKKLKDLKPSNAVISTSQNPTSLVDDSKTPVEVSIVPISTVVEKKQKSESSLDSQKIAENMATPTVSVPPGNQNHSKYTTYSSSDSESSSDSWQPNGYSRRSQVTSAAVLNSLGIRVHGTEMVSKKRDKNSKEASPKTQQ